VAQRSNLLRAAVACLVWTQWTEAEEKVEWIAGNALIVSFAEPAGMKGLCKCANARSIHHLDSAHMQSNEQICCSLQLVLLQGGASEGSMLHANCNIFVRSESPTAQPLVLVGLGKFL
jgi:hypothetical protein